MRPGLICTYVLTFASTVAAVGQSTCVSHFNLLDQLIDERNELIQEVSRYVACRKRLFGT